MSSFKFEKGHSLDDRHLPHKVLIYGGCLGIQQFLLIMNDVTTKREGRGQRSIGSW